MCISSFYFFFNNSFFLSRFFSVESTRISKINLAFIVKLNETLRENFNEFLLSNSKNIRRKN